MTALFAAILVFWPKPAATPPPVPPPTIMQVSPGEPAVAVRWFVNDTRVTLGVFEAAKPSCYSIVVRDVNGESQTDDMLILDVDCLAITK